MNEFQHYKVNVRTGTAQKVYFIRSNMFQKDIVKRLFPASHETVCNGEFINPTCLRFTVLPHDLKDTASIVYVTYLYPSEVLDLEKFGGVKQWKRVYKI